jgi:Transposase DDE domain
VIARRATSHGSGLGRLRWVVERTFAWLHNFRRLRPRWERHADIHYAFLTGDDPRGRAREVRHPEVVADLQLDLALDRGTSVPRLGRAEYLRPT